MFKLGVFMSLLLNSYSYLCHSYLCHSISLSCHHLSGSITCDGKGLDLLRIVNWLKRVFDAIFQLEQIPTSFKLGMIVPVHKGKGRDPLNCNNYRGITLTSVLSKCLEVIILERLLSLFVP